MKIVIYLVFIKDLFSLISEFFYTEKTLKKIEGKLLNVHVNVKSMETLVINF